MRRGSLLAAACAAVVGVLLASPAAAQLGAISGTVTDGVTGIAGVQVEALSLVAGGPSGSAVTAAGGSFAIANLPTGSYVVRASLPGYATEYYDNQRTYNAATHVQVTAPGTTALGTAIVLSTQAGGMSGTVTLAGGVPVPSGVYIEIFESNGPSTEYVDTFPVTAGTGAYDTGLSLRPFASYVARVTGAPGFGTQWSGGALSGPAAAEIDVVAGVTTTGVNFALPIGRAIQGRITCAAAAPPLCPAAGDPVAGALIGVVDAATGGLALPWSFSDGNGDFDTGPIVSPGTYRVYAVKDGLVRTAYIDATNVDQGDPVVVASDADATGIDIALGPAGSISGVVLDESFAPIEGASVQAQPSFPGALTESATTAADGTFTIPDLTPGTYRIQVVKEGFAFEWYDDKARYNDAILVPVVGLSDTPLANPIVLSSNAGGISGTVSLAGGAPLPASAWVDVYDSTGAYLRSVQINPATGIFTTGNTLRAGASYLLRVSNIPGFGTLWSGGGLSSGSATLISVTTGVITSNAATAFALPVGGGIKGTITCAAPKPPVCANAGEPVPGATVNVNEAANGRFTVGTTAGAGGSYDTGRILSPGTYTVNAIAPGFLRTTRPGTVTVVAGADVTAVDIALQPEATISGVITDGGAPIAGATVVVSGPSFVTVVTAADGSYSAGGLAAGTYRVRAVKPGFATRWYKTPGPSAPSDQTATAIALVAGGGAVGIDIALPAGAGGIAGRVLRASDNSPIAGVNVNVTIVNPDGTSGGFVTAATTDAVGNYDTGLILATGTYRLQVGNAPGFALLWSGNESSFNLATNIVVVVGQTTDRNANAAVDFSLPLAGGITGFITCAEADVPAGCVAAGSPIAGATVEIYEDPGGDFVRSVTTSATGSFSTAFVLKPGPYRVLARRAGFLTRYFGVPVPATTFATAAPVTVVASADAAGTNIALPPGRSISGTIRNATTAAPLAGALVDVFDATTGALVVGAFNGSGTTLVTGGSGFYTTASILPKGTYKVRARLPGFLDRFFANKVDLVSADPIDVTAANAVTRDIDLPPLPPRLSLRDDFELSEIDASLWGGTLEIRRQVLDKSGNHVFESHIRQFGTAGESVLSFVNPNSVNSIQATVTVTAVDVAGAQPRARLAGAFYNDGVTPGGGRGGDVVGQIVVRRLGSNLELFLSVFRCLDAACATSTNVFFDNTTFDAGSLGTPRTLFLGWDGSGLFTFGVDGVTISFDAGAVIPVPGGPAGLPRSPYRQIGTRVDAFVSSTAGGSITAEFDDVRVNGAPYDDFESAELDAQKWINQEISRSVSGGVLTSSIRQFAVNATNSLRVADPDAVSALQADVTVTAADSQGATPAARVHGAFYNCLNPTPGSDPTNPCGDGPGVGREGDVLAQVRISLSDGALRGGYVVTRCVVDNCNVPGEFEVLVVDDSAFGVVEPGSTHRLAVAWTGSEIVFRFDGITVMFDPKPFAPLKQTSPSVPFRELATRLTGIGGPAEGGSITATFDNFVAGYFATGRITEGNGVVPIAGATVTAYEAVSGTPVGAPATSAADGTYTIPDLPNGNYKIGAVATGFNPRFFDSKSSLATADPVTVPLVPIPPAPPMVGAALGVDIALVAAGAGTRSTALAAPLLIVPSAGASGPQALGEIEIIELGDGVLAPGASVSVALPAGLAFAATPSASTDVSNGLTLGGATVVGPASFQFTVLTGSAGNPARLRVSNLLVTAPAGFPAGPVAVSIGGSGGVTAESVVNGSALPVSNTPAIDPSVSGSVGLGATDEPVVVTGANFLPGATVCVGTLVPGPPPACSAVPGVTVTTTVDGATQVTAQVDVAPGTTVGTYDLYVINPGGETANLAGAVSIGGAPQVTSTNRQANPLAQSVPGQAILVTGSGFLPPTTTPPDIIIAFSGTGITATAVEYRSSTELLVTVGVAEAAAIGQQFVTVINPDGGVGTPGPNALVSVAAPSAGDPIGLGAPKGSASPPPPPPPSISAVAGPSGQPAGPTGSTATITGTGFTSTSAVTFAGAGGMRVPAASMAFVSSTQLTATVPTNAVDGSVTVSVDGSLSNGVTFTVTNPRLVAASPASVTQGTGASLTLTGTKFATGASVAFSPSTGIQVGAPAVAAEGTSLTLPVTIDPTASAGFRDATVTNPDGGASTLASAVEVKPPAVAELLLSLVGTPAASYLPAVGPVSVTLDATGRCTAKTVTPTAVTVQAKFVSATQPAPPSVTFTLTSSALPGTATNEDCEPALPATKDFGIGNPSPAAQQAVVGLSAGNVYQTTLYSFDMGGTVIIDVSTTVAGAPVTARLRLPVDSDQDGIPDAWEANPVNAGVLNAQNGDQNGNGIPDGQDRVARDGLSNADKYRGVYMVGPKSGSTGTMSGHQRLGAGQRHLFVRGRGFGNDPTMPAGTCGVNPTGDSPIPDGNLSVANPCPPFAVGPAFVERGVRVMDATASFTASTQLPSRSYANGTSPTLDLLTVVYDGFNCSGAEACDQTTKIGIRQFQFPTLGFSTFGTATTYGTARVFKRAVDAYFAHRPYQHKTNDPSRVVLAADGRPMLAPITLVADKNDNGLKDKSESTDATGSLLGDTYVAGSASQTLSAVDTNNDGCVELPAVPDPTTIAGVCNPGAASGSGHASQATKAQVVRSVTTHEIGHAAGINIHTTDPSDLMYQYSINWLRDGHFSQAAADLMQIHNKAQQ